MKEYPHIKGSSKAPQLPCIAFCKYDGSNLRFEWTKKRGWYKFGTRTQMIDGTHPVFGEGIRIFLNKYGDQLAKVFVNSSAYRNRESAMAFCEFFGAKSFAGIHVPEDPKDVILFDINVHKIGILGPKEFLDNFSHLDIAEVVYTGNLNEELKRLICTGEIGFVSNKSIRNKVWEGVVCKGGEGHKLWMAKIKTEKYKQALQELFHGEWQKYFE